MNEKSNKTAVEWLVDKLMKGEFINSTNELIEQAKQMEKEQIMESWNDGNFLGRNGNILLEYNTGEQYYNETYKKD